MQKKVDLLKNKIKPHHIKPVLRDPNVVTCLEDLHSKFVFVPIGKASNNIAIVCKKFYIEKLIHELGLLDTPSETYTLVNTEMKDIVNLNIELCKSYNLSISEKDHRLPYMYWTLEMHYTPSRARFKVVSSSCSTKPISKVVSTIFKKILDQIENFHNKCTFYNNYNMFWVIQNSKPVLEKLAKINKYNKAKFISTFDFSTLYTKLPHDDLIEVLNVLIDFVFNGGRNKPDDNRKFLTVKTNRCYFTRTKSSS
ncbi:MAG: hypothetical protein AAF501_10900, partial [Pseudomonadota bacterium]